MSQVDADAFADRFWKKVDKEADNGCWLWIGTRRPLRADGSPGYGAFTFRGRTHVAHRLSYEMLVGPIPEGLVLDHLCRNHGCVNPAHLEPVTVKENIMRGTAPTAKHAAKTHCVHGHPFTPDNIAIRVRKFGNSIVRSRSCLACRKMRSTWKGQVGKARRAAYYATYVPYQENGNG